MLYVNVCDDIFDIYDIFQTVYWENWEKEKTFYSTDYQNLRQVMYYVFLLDMTVGMTVLINQAPVSTRSTQTCTYHHTVIYDCNLNSYLKLSHVGFLFHYQPATNCSKLTIKALEQGAKYVQS